MKTCAFTGHRPKGLGYPESDGRCAALKEKLRSLIVKLIEEEGVTHFISGMAQGVDMYGRRCGGRKPCGIVTFSIAGHCDKETMLQTHYTQDCLRNRNRYMVEHADMVLAVCNMRRQSGTRQTVWFAQNRRKPVWLVFPDTLELSVI